MGTVLTAWGQSRQTYNLQTCKLANLKTAETAGTVPGETVFNAESQRRETAGTVPGETVFNAEPQRRGERRGACEEAHGACPRQAQFGVSSFEVSSCQNSVEDGWKETAGTVPGETVFNVETAGTVPGETVFNAETAGTGIM